MEKVSKRIDKIMSEAISLNSSVVELNKYIRERILKGMDREKIPQEAQNAVIDAGSIDNFSFVFNVVIEPDWENEEYNPNGKYVYHGLDEVKTKYKYLYLDIKSINCESEMEQITEGTFYDDEFPMVAIEVIHLENKNIHRDSYYSFKNLIQWKKDYDNMKDGK